MNSGDEIFREYHTAFPSPHDNIFQVFRQNIVSKSCSFRWVFALFTAGNLKRLFVNVNEKQMVRYKVKIVYFLSKNPLEEFVVTPSSIVLAK